MRKLIFVLLVWLIALPAYAQMGGSPISGGGSANLPGSCSNGQVVVFNTTTGLWDTCAANAASGTGNVSNSGTPTNHQWPGWTDATTIKGFTVTASKPVCTDASGDPAVCAGTEGVWQGADADLTSLAGGLSGPIKGLGNGSGYSAAAYGDIVGLWTTCTGYLKSDGTCDAGSGGSVSVSGTPSNHQWAGWTNSSTIKGFSVTASKVVCSDSNADPVACTNLTDAAIPTAATLHLDDVVTLTGVAAESTNLGAFTGSTITDNQTIKAAFQLLETAFEALPGGHTQNTDSGTTGQTFQLQSGSTGFKLKNNSGVAEIRNAADAADANFKAATITASTGFSGNLTGNVTGNADTATSATAAGTVVVIDSTDASSYIAMFDSATGTMAVKTDAGLTYNATTGILSATGFSGPINGTVGGTTPAAGSFTSLTATGTTTLATSLTGVLRSDSGVVSVDADVTDLVSAASTTVAGKIEIATNAETTAGTDTARAVTPDDLAYLFARPFAIGSTTPAAVTATTFSAGGQTGTCDSTITQGFCVDADGDAFVKSLTSIRVAGQAGYNILYEIPANGNSSVTLKAPDSLAADYTSTLPSNTGTLLSTGAAVTVAQGGTGVATLTGIVKASGTSNFAAAAYSDIVGLWTTCTGYLKNDGTCDSPTGVGDVTGGSASGAGELAAYTDTGGKAITRSYVSFSGPSTSVKAKTISNAADTIAELGQANAFTAAMTFSGAGTFSAAGATSSIPMVVGTATASGVTAAGQMYFESDTEILTIGDGATSISLDMAPNVVYTFPTATSTLARTDAGQTFTGVQAFTAPTVATSITPNTAANASLGTTLLPFSSVFIGDEATNNVQLINTAATGAVVLTLPSTTGTLALNPMTTAGDIIVGGTSGAPARLAAGTAGNPLVGGGAGTAPAYAAYNIASPGAAGAVLYSDGTNWTRSVSPSLTSPTMATPVVSTSLAFGTTGGIMSASGGAITLAGLGNTNNENLIFNFEATANKVAISSGTGVTDITTALNLVSTGTIQGGVLISSDADGMDAAAMTAVGVRGTMFIATGAGTWILPRAVLGDSLCLMDSGTAHDLILDVTAGSTIRLKGTEGSDGVGITNASGSTTGDFVCVVAVATDKWSTVGMQGTWASQ